MKQYFEILMWTFLMYLIVTSNLMILICFVFWINPLTFFDYEHYGWVLRYYFVVVIIHSIYFYNKEDY